MRRKKHILCKQVDKRETHPKKKTSHGDTHGRKIRKRLKCVHAYMYTRSKKSQPNMDQTDHSTIRSIRAFLLRSYCNPLYRKTRGNTITRLFDLREMSSLRRCSLLNLEFIPTCPGSLDALVVFLSSRRFQRYVGCPVYLDFWRTCKLERIIKATAKGAHVVGSYANINT
jgi:hypothetical protein